MSPKLPPKNKSNITSIASKQTKQSNWWLGYGHRICSLMDFHSLSLQQLRSSQRESFDWQTDSLKASFTKIYYRSELPWTNRLKKITAQ
jgi:hypothetical protein